MKKFKEFLKKSFKGTNVFFVVGLIIVVILMAFILFPDKIATKNPYSVDLLKSYTDDNGKFIFKSAPFGPDEEFILGTDDSGRDVFSFIVYGTRLTLTIALSVTLLRFILGLIIGISAGFENTFSKQLIHQFNNIFSSIPPLIISIIVLSVGYLGTFDKSISSLIFILVLTFVEWARVGDFFYVRTTEILEKDFIRSEYAIGKSNIQIAVTNVIPHLVNEGLTLFFMEIARVLGLLMQLGIFGIFIGNLKIVLSTDNGAVVGKATSYEPEWASMLGSSKNYIRSAPWIVISSAVAFFISVLGFNFLGEGIRRRLSSKQDAQSLKSFRGFVLGLAIIFTSVLLIPVFFDFSLITSYSYTGTNVDIKEGAMYLGDSNVDGNIDSITDYLHEIGVISGDVDKFKASGVKSYKIDDYMIINDSTVRLNGNPLDNYQILSFGNFDGEGKVISLEKYDLVSGDFESAQFRDMVSGRFVILNKQLYSTYGLIDMGEKILRSTDAKGILLFDDDMEDIQVGSLYTDGVIVKLPTSMEINEYDNIKVEVEAAPVYGNGKDLVLGISTDKSRSNGEYIVLSFPLDYSNYENGKQMYNFALNLVRNLNENRDKLKKSVLIIFREGTYTSDLLYEKMYKNEHYFDVAKGVIYIDFRCEDVGGITYDDRYVALTKPSAFSFKNYLIENMKSGGLDVTYDPHMASRSDTAYLRRGVPSLYLGIGSDDKELKRLQKSILDTIINELY